MNTTRRQTASALCLALAVLPAFAAADHVVRVSLVNNRVAPVFLEPRAALAEVDPASGRLTLRAGSQTAHRMRDTLAGMLGIDTADLRVVTPDTGGGFGARTRGSTGSHRGARVRSANDPGGDGKFAAK